MHAALLLPLTVRFAHFASAVLAVSERVEEEEAARLQAHVHSIRSHLRRVSSTTDVATIENETWAAAATALALCDEAEHDVMPLAQELLKACKAIEQDPRKNQRQRYAMHRDRRWRD